MPPRRRRLWQHNSPIAPYSRSSDDESPSDHSDADESNYSYGSVGSNFMPTSLTAQQYTNIADALSPVEEDSSIEYIESRVEEDVIIKSESPEQEDAIIKSESPQQADDTIKTEIPQQKDAIIKSESSQQVDAIIKSEGPFEEDIFIKPEIPQQEDAIIKSESPQQEDAIIKSESPFEEDIFIKPEIPQQEDAIVKSESLQQEDTIIKSESPQQEHTITRPKSPEPSAVLKSLPLYATDIQPEESILPSPPDPIKSESQIDDIIMADDGPSPTAGPLSDTSSHTLGRDSPTPKSVASTEILSSEDEVTDRCYGFLLLHYLESLPKYVDTISILLIYQRRPHGLPPYWGFPKGHPEPEDRSDWESATRELLEETGLAPERVEPITPSGFSPPLPDSVARLRPDYMSIISQYPSLDGGIKEVTYFLARVAELEKLTEQVEELVECRWVKLSEAWELVDTKPVKKVLAKLIGLVSSGPKTVVAKSDLIRWKEVDALDENGMPRQWRSVGFCTPE
ncbi:hypothetical protein V496_01887 [Pseudogymnoascus sp. VKM F-4515 (FW-2607)]|nr:hypothetical protein V496_01887 [Pseudogymnoascus sp. VKM F-4515 (FW-2607)]